MHIRLWEGSLTLNRWKKVTLREKKTSLAKEERGEEYLLLEGEQGVWMEISRVLANTSQESHRG